ncbi:MAG: HD-GYP domain-containing protein [Gemmatimonadota bacterium]
MVPMSSPARDTIFGFSTPVARGAAVVVLMAAVTAFLLSVPENGDGWHGSGGLVQKFYFLPLMLAAAWFGVRGAVAATLTVTAVAVWLIVASRVSPGAQIERMGEVGVFWLVGALAANFFEQQKKHLGDLETANENTLYVLASALDVREENTGSHSRRVAGYAIRLAEEMGIDDRDTLAVIRKGALLHDLGKIGIPDSILLKPGALDEAEWKLMRRHTEVGFEMLAGVGFLQEPAEIVLYHHEWYDGRGYPKGLKGEEIPLGARLFAVIDVFDAITTARPYRTPDTYAGASAILRQKGGTHLDPRIVQCFERVPYSDWEAIASDGRAIASPRTRA